MFLNIFFLQFLTFKFQRMIIFIVAHDNFHLHINHTATIDRFAQRGLFNKPGSMLHFAQWRYQRGQIFAIPGYTILEPEIYLPAVSAASKPQKESKASMHHQRVCVCSYRTVSNLFLFDLLTTFRNGQQQTHFATDVHCTLCNQCML